MRYLFIHQTIPGQFPHLAKSLANDPNNRVVFLTRFGTEELPGVETIRYRVKPQSGPTHPQLQNLQNGVVAAEAVAETLLRLETDHSFRPDLIYAHPGWGETLFVKEIFPDVPVIHYAEYYYHTLGSDSFATPDEVPVFADYMRLTMKNAVNLMSLDLCDRAVTPTKWQLRQQPETYRNKISVIHDGIDTTIAKPNPATVLQIPDGTRLSHGDEVVTYINRNLEPVRGMFTFAEAADAIARKRPNCRFLVVGSETGRYYGPVPPKGQSYREMAVARLGAARDRCFFMGKLPYPDFIRVLQVSAAHVYLTRPFVLSWSMLEAMSAGCVVIGAASPPVAEVISDDENGLLVDPFSAEELAERIDEALEDKQRMREIAGAARQTILDRYDLEMCLRAQEELIADTLAAGDAARFGIPPRAAE
ncbi:MAG: glycosyltransferase [Hyphomicrobiales bacterium]|nr:glycosyltransferase [Hyphomicrobiales bacterium]